MKYYLNYLKYGLAAMIAFSLPACSDDDAGDTSNQEDPDNPNPPENPDEPKDPDDPDTPYDPDTPVVEPEDGWNALLLPSMATDVEIANKSTVRLGVTLVSLKGEHAGEGMVGEKIKWGIESGNKSITIASGKSTTQEEGFSTMNVSATTVAGNAVVVASSALAPKAVKFNIKVLDKPTGNIDAKTAYDGLAPVKNYAIRLYDGSEVQCAYTDLKSGSILNYQTETEATPLFPAVNESSALFENLSTEMKYTLIAYGYSEEGAPVAAGCLDSGLNVRGSETLEAIIHLSTIDLDPTTTYHVRSYFDLGDVASALGSVGKFIVLLTNFADNPGATLYDIILDLVKDYISGILGKAIDKVLELTKIDKTLIGSINDIVKSNQGACKVGLFACQFRNIVRTMEFMGDLEIEKIGTVELQGKDAYNGVAAYWRLNCDTDETGNYVDSNCGRLPLSTSMLGLDKDINFLEGGWKGSVANGYDKLSVEAHMLELYYGKIIVYLINNVLLPRVAGGAKTFEDALAYWINCNSVGQWLSSTLTRCIGFETELTGCVGWRLSVSKSQGTDWCKSAASTLGTVLNFATAYAELQKAGSELNISGTAMFKDTNADNIVDDIYSGVWSGNMTITTSSDDKNGSTKISTVTGVKGIWSAYNKMNVENGNGSIYCTYPKTETDSSDQLCSYPPIDVNSLVSTDLCKDYAKCAK